MNLKVKILGLEIGGKAIVILNREDAEELGIRSSGRVKVKYDNKQLTAIVNVTERITNSGTIGISEEVRSILKIKDGDAIDVNVAEFPSSLQFIKNKLNGRKLNYEEIYAIIKDVVEGNLDEIEITSFVTALDLKGIDIDEAASLTAAMVETGKTLKLNKKIIVDKHSIGGAVGDKTTLVAVPIIASLGLAIPKTSSRAITSAAGTADKAEVLMPVNLDIEQMQGIVEKTNGCIVWGGRLNLAPADDIFIKISSFLFPLFSLRSFFKRALFIYKSIKKDI